MHDSTGITPWLLQSFPSLSFSPSAFKQCRMHKPVPQGGVTKLWTRCMCLFLTHSSVAAAFNLYSRHVAAYELQLCPINQPNSYWCCTLQLTLHLPHITQTLQDSLELSCKDKACRWKQGQAIQEAHGPTGQACRDGIRKTNTQVELKLKFPLDLRNVKGSKGSTGTAAAKRRPKTGWAHCWGWGWWGGTDEMHRKMSGTYWLLCFSLLWQDLLSSLSHSWGYTLGKETLPRVRQIRDKMHIQAGQYMHPWFTRADQRHSFLECSSKWSSSPGTGNKQYHTA